MILPEICQPVGGKINPLLKKAWVDALRSGMYKQGRGFLCSLDNKGANPTYCCIGVLCEVMDQNAIKLIKKIVPIFSDIDNKILVRYVIRYALEKDNDIDRDAKEAYISSDIMKLIGADDDQFHSLIVMNDGDFRDGIGSQSFEIIADHIEKEL